MIFDTTLRDGEQSPGCSMAQPEKLRIARALADLGVDVIEAGFPPPSRGDWDSVNAVAREVQGPIICGLARCNRDDITRAAKPWRQRRVRASTCSSRPSAIHRAVQARHGAGEIIEAAGRGREASRASTATDVEFSPRTHRAQSSTSSRRSSRP
jgi:2-isopropylmalate synthase